VTRRATAVNQLVLWKQPGKAGYNILLVADSSNDDTTTRDILHLRQADRFAPKFIHDRGGRLRGSPRGCKLELLPNGGHNGFVRFSESQPIRVQFSKVFLGELSGFQPLAQPVNL